jgi:hypothetical protein
MSKVTTLSSSSNAPPVFFQPILYTFPSIWTAAAHLALFFFNIDPTPPTRRPQNPKATLFTFIHAGKPLSVVYDEKIDRV